jgi:glycosyltransferase involved in cell wall biosynthesis
LIVEKGVHVAIEATDILRRSGQRVRLLVCGDGPQTAHLRRLVAHRGLTDQVTFIGRVANEDMPAYVSAADVVVLPTLRSEGLPFVLLEAMACERAAVVARFPGVEDVLESGREGLVVDPGDAVALADRVSLLISNSGLRSRLGANARGRVEERFAEAQMVDETVRLLTCASTYRPNVA